MSYVPVCSGGAVFIVAYNVLGAMFRGIGDSKTPLLTSLLFCFIGCFNGRGNTTFVMVQGIVGAFLVRIPVSLAMSRLEPVPLFRVGLAAPCSTAVQIVLFLGFYTFTAARDRKLTAELRESEHPVS